MDMAPPEPRIQPRVVNLLVPMLSVIGLSIFFFWLFGSQRPENHTVLEAFTNSEPNKAMLVALLITLFTLLISSVLFAVQRYPLKALTQDVISGGSQIVSTLAILILAWPLASGRRAPCVHGPHRPLRGDLRGHYFIGSGWGAASLLMPIAIPLATSVGGSLPLAVAAARSATSPLSGMTNMAANVVKADHARYIKYLAPYNFGAAALAAVLFLVAGLLT